MIISSEKEITKETKSQWRCRFGISWNGWMVHGWNQSIYTWKHSLEIESLKNVWRRHRCNYGEKWSGHWTFSQSRENNKSKTDDITKMVISCCRRLPADSTNHAKEVCQTACYPYVPGEIITGWKFGKDFSRMTVTPLYLNFKKELSDLAGIMCQQICNFFIYDSSKIWIHSLSSKKKGK